MQRKIAAADAAFEITWDRLGVAHVWAQTVADAYRGHLVLVVAWDGGVGGVVCIPRNAAALVFFLPIAKRRRRSNSNTLSLSSERKKRGEERARATEEERIRNVFQGIRFSCSNWHLRQRIRAKKTTRSLNNNNNNNNNNA